MFNIYITYSDNPLNMHMNGYSHSASYHDTQSVDTIPYAVSGQNVTIDPHQNWLYRETNNNYSQAIRHMRLF